MNNSSPTFTGKNYRITILSERLIRFEYSKKGIFLDKNTGFAVNRSFPRISVEVSDDNKYLVVSTKYFTFQYTKENNFYASKLFPDTNLRVKLTDTDKLWYPNHPEARNFKTNTMDLEDINKLTYDKSLYSTDGFVVIDDSNGLVEYEQNYIPRVDGNVDLYLFMYKRDFANCLKDFYTLTGKPLMIPKYALGIWWNRDRIYNFSDSCILVNLFKKYDIPISVFLLSEFWHIKDSKDVNLHKSGYSFSKELFPEPEKLIKWMHSNNIKVGLNMDPTEGINSLEPSYPLFHEKYKTENFSNIPFNVYDIDFIKLFKDKLIKPLFEMGTDFLWIDYKDNNNKVLAFNEVIKSSYSNNQRYFSLTRNFGLGTQRYGAIYTGETKVSWKTLEFLPSFTSSGANSGLSWWSHDVGGFKNGIEDDELYLRYVQYSAFSPIFRFSAKRGPYYKREPWLWDIKTLTIVRNYCFLRYRLIPYIYSEGYKHYNIGTPLTMPLYYQIPSIYDEPIYKNEYYFGSQFLISPITKPKNELIKRSIEKLYLPEGVWYDFKTGKKFMGNKRYVTFYKDEDFPIFVRAGAIVPLSMLSANKNDLSNPTTLELNIFPGKSNTYDLYEDDGISNNYLNKDYHITSIDYNYMANNYTLIIRKIEGNSDIIPPKRNYIVKFRNTKKPTNITIFINAEAYNNYDVYIDETDFLLRIYDVDTTKQLTINCGGKDIEIDASRIFNEDINSIINDLKIDTNIKEELASIMFNDTDIKLKRIRINKLSKKGLHKKFITMFLKLLEYNQ